MPGFFFASYKDDNIIKNISPIHEKNRNFNYSFGKDYCAYRNTLNKFVNDKVFIDNEQYLIICDGVILNLTNLLNKYGVENLYELLMFLYNSFGDSFFKVLKGSFSGILYDKNNDKIISFTNHIGDKSLFYYYQNGLFIVSNDLDRIIDFLKTNKINVNLDLVGSYYLLTYGFMIEDQTLIDSIKKLSPGKYILILNNIFYIKEYHRFNNYKYPEINRLSEQDLIEEIDNRFRAAVKLQFNKDLEYRYSHIANLSGGLDSRMINWVARELNYKDILNTTYSQSNYKDEIIAKQISSDLGNEFIFKSLDDASFIYDLENVVEMNWGLAFYTGITGGKKLYEILDFSRFGLDHTGQLGDVVIGTFSTSRTHNQPKKPTGFYSSKLINRLEHNYINKYETEELFKLYSRGFNGALSSHMIRQHFSEVASPFLDIDLLEFCLSIDPGRRINHNLYKKWIITKYPKASQYEWEKINGKITENESKIYIKNIFRHYMRKYLNRFLYSLSITKTPYDSKNMNPFDYWYYTNINMKTFMDSYFKSNINLLNINTELRNDATYLYNYGNTVEKTQVLTLLAFVKKYIA